MSIAGGLFNSNQKREDVDDAGAAADGDSESTLEEAQDLTTAVPDFGADDDGDDDAGFVLGDDLLEQAAATGDEPEG